MNSYCNKCGRTDCCGGCSAPCAKDCRAEINVDPYDPNYWWFSNCDGEPVKVHVPKINETCTTLSTDFSNATLNYKSECGLDKITGRQLGQLINLNDLRDVEAENPDSCSMLVWNPHCDYCADGCTKIGAAWEPYHIPDADNCIMEPDEDGYYHILKKTDCGCPVECKLPVVPNGMTTLNYIRDSVPDDPDFPWYYGQYNDKINLHLAENAPEYFGKFALKVTVNYGVQALRSNQSPNVNFRSLVCPVIEGESVRVTKASSILQSWAMIYPESGATVPWGTTSLRGSFVFIVPKGKEAYLHHEFRLRTGASFPKYATHSLDGQRVPDEIAGQVDKMLYIGSRLNALQVIIEPTQGATNYEPVADAYRDQLDAAVDEYPPIE